MTNFKRNNNLKFEKAKKFLILLLCVTLFLSAMSLTLSLLPKDKTTSSPGSGVVEPSPPDDDNVDSLLTPYGRIPEEYAQDPEKYPILLFQISTREVIWAGDRFGGEGVYGGVLYQLKNNASNGDMAVFFQNDHTDIQDPEGKLNPFFNFGAIEGNHIIDLNGHTFIASTTIFHSQAKNKGNLNSVSWHIKNGTIDLNSHNFLYVGSNSAEEHTMLSNFLVENIYFANITSGRVVADNNRGSDYYDTVTDVCFRNCTFDILQSDRSALFHFGKTDTSTFDINITVEGGNISFVEASLPVLFDDGGLSNKTFIFAEGEQGFTTLTLPINEVQAFDEPFNTTSGQRYFVLSAIDPENYCEYELSEKTA